MATIAVRYIRKTYGEIRAVDGVSFEVQPGEFVGILGPNGWASWPASRSS
jgi:ABC-2 type transport system ATP-binding protein